MGDGHFNVSKGGAGEMARNDNTKFVVLLLQVAEADATLIDYDTVAAILAAANTEADFASYSRLSTTDTDVIRTVDDSGDLVELDMADLVWALATAGQNIVKLIIAYNDGAGDANLIPIAHYDFVVTTDGTDITAIIHASGFLNAT